MQLFRLHVTGLMGLVVAVGCEDTRPAVTTTALEKSAFDAEAIGERRIDDSPFFIREAACPDGAQCLTADINGDRRADLVQIDHHGKLGKRGGVWVAKGNGYGFGAASLEALCSEDLSCSLGDIDGDGTAELVSFYRGKGEVYVATLGHGLEGSKPSLLLKDFCIGETSHCHVADVSGDRIGDLVWLADGAIRLAVREKDGWQRREIEQKMCSEGRACLLENIDGEPGVELVALSSRDKQLPIEVLTLRKEKEKPRVWFEKGCAPGAACSFRDISGDGRADLLEVLDAKLTIYTAKKDTFELASAQAIPACKNTSRCWFADATADGRADWWVVDLEGVLSIFENRDSIGRLDTSARQLSMLAQDYARGYRKRLQDSMQALTQEALALPAAWPSYFQHPDFSWPATVPVIDERVFDAQSTALVDDIEGLATEVLASIPTATDLLEEVDQRRWQRAAGHIIAARTSLFAGAVGATPRAGTGRCGNVVVHDRYRIDGADHLEGSYLARYFDALREPEQEDRVEHAVGALTAIWEGLRCLSQQEIATLETAFVEAVVTTANDLIDRGHPLLARRMWDRSLPIALVLFDAAHHFSVPTIWRLLQAKIVGDDLVIPAAPDPGFDFAAAAIDTACDTLWCQLYRHPGRESLGLEVLTLDEIGVWVADVRQGNRLHRIDILGDDLITGMIDLRHFGEGGCQLFEVLGMGMKCPGARTCSAGDTMLAEAMGPLEPAPGMPGSRWSHLFTDRRTLAADNGCDSSGGSGGGGAPIAGCGGPPLRSSSGRFSPNPEVDRMFRCVMESAGTPIDVVQDFNLNPDCLLRDPPMDGGTPPPDDGGTPPPAGTPPPETTPEEASATWEDPDVQNQLTDFYGLGRGTINGRTREDVARAIVAAVARAGGSVSYETVIGRMEDLVGSFFGPGQTHTRAMEGLGHPAGTTSGEILYDPVLLAQAVDRLGASEGMSGRDVVSLVMAHEFIHVVMNALAGAGFIDRSWLHNFDRVHDTIHRPLGLHARSCGTEGACTNSCGLIGALARRFTSCLEATDVPSVDDVLCDLYVDYCEGRMTGDIGGYPLGSQCQGSPHVSANSECFVVNCDGGGSIGGACCAAMADGAFTEVVFWESPDPGPMPPPPDLFCTGPLILSELPFP